MNIPPPESTSPRILAALEEAVARLKAAESAKHEPIAIVGIGCRFPGGANDLDSFNRFVFANGDAVGRVPASRWDADALYDPDFTKPGRLYVRDGAFLDRIEEFDAEFFGISPREALSLDPQQRLLLEVTWEALENAGIRPNALAGSATGVFIGITCNDYARRIAGNDFSQIDTHFSTGNTLNAAAGRLSYVLGLEGPSLAIDTACSSSLVAVHLACQSLRGRECRAAVAGGVNLILSPEGSIAACKARMLAPDGRCKTFDASADGYGRGEGCGVVVLKRLSDALADGDIPHALIRGSAVNQDGASSGLTVPNGPAQQKLIAQALAVARIEPHEVAYLETHGTGTSLGDPIEYRAAVSSYGVDRRRPLILGAVKANIGHLEAAAGIAGLIKTVLVLQQRKVPAQIHFHSPNPHLPWRELAAEVPVAPVALDETERFAAVSSFGASGTNAHAILEAPPVAAEVPVFNRGSQHLLVLSAKTPGALREFARRYAEFARSSEPGDLALACSNAATTRDVFTHRLAIIAKDWSDVAEQLDRFQRGEEIGFAAGSDAERFVRDGIVPPTLPGCRRIRLPTYPWQRQRFWPGARGSTQAIDDWFYESEWRVAPLRPRTLASPIVVGNRLADRLEQIRGDRESAEYWEFIGTLERASAGYVTDALRTLGWDRSCELTDFMRGAKIASKHERLLRRLLQILEESDTTEPPPTVNSDRPEAELLHRCGSHIAAVLTGECDPLSLLFPGDDSVSAADLYSDAFGARLMNEVARNTIRHLQELAPERQLRVIEIGAGTGSTTAALLPVFDPERTRYTVTDVAPLLVSRARNRFAHHGFAEFKVLDIERSPRSQGFEQHSFDVVIAASVLHATRDIVESVRHARELLKPGGILVLLELTGRLRFLDLIFGLTDGWWRFADAPLRVEHPLISTAEWQQVLAANGFSESAVLGSEDGGGGVLSKQAVILGQAAPRRSKRWLIRGESMLATRLQQALGAEHTTGEETHCDGVVHFVECDTDVAHGCELLTRSALDLLQRILRGNVRGDETHLPPVCFVTRGAAAVPTPTVAGLAQSLISGLLKSIALEHPGWNCTWIDLPAEPSPAELRELVEELQYGSGEREVALREQRWVNRLVRAAVPTGKAFSANDSATYLITGGSRGLGPAVAQWLAERGARHIALLARTGPDNEAQSSLESARALGCRVETFFADVADEDQLRDVLARIETTMPPLRGVIHGAGALDDALLAQQNWERFRRVFRAKVDGAWNLHRLIAGMPVDFFVLFSSMASLFGSPGQSNHAAANAFLDALAHYRRSRGLQALSINWGPWSELGAAAQRGVDNRIRGSGVGGIATTAGLQALGRCLGSRVVQLGVVDIDWSLFREQFAADRRATWLEAFAKVPMRAPETDDIDRPARGRSNCALARRVREADAAVRPELLCEYVESRVREVLGIVATHALPPQRPLLELGFDSLMST